MLYLNALPNEFQKLSLHIGNSAISDDDSHQIFKNFQRFDISDNLTYSNKHK